MLTPEIDRIEKLDLGYKPEAAVSGAALIQTEYSAFLIFNANTSKLTRSGRYASAGIAVVELLRCVITKFGLPNDEAISGHPLYEKLEILGGTYAIFEVHNSSWKAQVQQQNQVVFPDWELSSRHFIFGFHESTFECLAEDIQLTISNEPYATVFETVAKRVLK